MRPGRGFARRLLGFVLLVALLVPMARVRTPAPQRPGRGSVGTVAPIAPSERESPGDLESRRGIPLDLGRPIESLPGPAPPALAPLALPSEEPILEPSAPVGRDAPAIAFLPVSPAESSAGGGSAGTAEMQLAVRVWVYPRLPERIIAKRKIDDVVVLQALVGLDGRVRAVRIVRGIANCEECTQCAVEAARKFVFEAPVLASGASQVWSEPFEMRFSYRR